MSSEAARSQLLKTLRGEPRLGAAEISDSPWVSVKRKDAEVAVVLADQLADGEVESAVRGLADNNVAVSQRTHRQGVHRRKPSRVIRPATGVLLLGNAAASFAEPFPEAACVGYLDDGFSHEALFRAVSGLLGRVALMRGMRRQASLTMQYQDEAGGVTEIARALSQERDLSALLPLVLKKSREITEADAGSVYLMEEDTDGEPQLAFKTTQNDSVSFEASEFSIPLSMTSIAGAAAVTRRPMNIADVHRIDPSIPFSFDASFDEKVGYRTKSMIAVPMVSAQGEVLGVIQLINKKRHAGVQLTSDATFEEEVVPFDERSQSLLLSLASQAGIAVENARLYEEIRNIFEGFVRASVQAIEQRDPTTSGHSVRVSNLSCGLASVVHREERGQYSEAAFSRTEMKELEYAALLHDFGKIGVREQVLVKAKKLYPEQLESILNRLAYAEKAAEAEWLKAKLAAARGAMGSEELQQQEGLFERQRGVLASARTVVLHANEPTILSEGDFSVLGQLAQASYLAPDGSQQPLLSESEVVSLQVSKGSLTAHELDEIRSHVSHTIAFLDQIPWGKFMGRIPVIAGAHHEKLDGSGYPHGLKDAEIPLPSKIMTVADIFDALTARDRPYKRAVPTDRALGILELEVKDGHVDGELVRLFIESRAFEQKD